MKIKKFSLLFLSVLFFLSACKNPQSEYCKEDDFGKMEKIDAHVHYNSSDPAFIDEAIKDNFRLLTVNVAWDFFGKKEQQEKYAQKLMQDFQGEIDFIATFSLDGFEDSTWQQKTIESLDSSIAKGAVAVKFWKNIGMELKDNNGKFVMIDDARFDPIFKHIEKKGISILAHIGEPKNCWLPLDKMTVGGDKSYYSEHPEHHMFLHPENPSYEQLIQARNNVLKKYPNIKFIGAHLGSLEWSVDELAKHLDMYPNFAVDMAERICHLQYQSVKDWQKVQDFIIKYQDRILYATDKVSDGKEDAATFKAKIHATWIEDWKYFTMDELMRGNGVDGSFNGLGLPRTVIKKIYHDNAEIWYPRLKKVME